MGAFGVSKFLIFLRFQAFRRQLPKVGEANRASTTYADPVPTLEVAPEAPAIAGSVTVAATPPSVPGTIGLFHPDRLVADPFTVAVGLQIAALDTVATTDSVEPAG
jgi:hypothetical protein